MFYKSSSSFIVCFFTRYPLSHTMARCPRCKSEFLRGSKVGFNNRPRPSNGQAFCYPTGVVLITLNKASSPANSGCWTGTGYSLDSLRSQCSPKFDPPPGLKASKFKLFSRCVLRREPFLYRVYSSAEVLGGRTSTSRASSR